MPAFKYTAINALGKTVKGVQESSSKADLKVMLEARQLIPLEIFTAEADPSKMRKGFFSAVPSNELTVFTRQMSVLLKSGLPMMEALGICGHQTSNVELKKVILNMQDQISNGQSLSQALALYPGVFNSVYISLVRAGEESGALDQVLTRLAEMITYEEEVKKDIKGALRYPIAVLIFLISAFFIIVTYVIPKLAANFNKAGVELPLPTRICIGIHHVIQNHWFLAIILLTALVISFIAFKNSAKGRYIIDHLLIKTPYVGNLVTQSIMYRFAYIYRMLTKSGITVVKSMDILADVVGNSAVAKDFVDIKLGVEEGEPVSNLIQKSDHFTDLMGSIIAVGEKTGDMETLLDEASQYYYKEMKYSLSKLTDILPVFLTIAMAVMVGFFVLSIYLPLFDISKVAGGMKVK